MEDEIFEQRTDLGKLNAAVQQIKDTLGSVIVGQHHTIDLLIAGEGYKYPKVSYRRNIK